MQLKGLEIYGFKSFGEKTKFIFDSGITGIVGPNGCGKSNIVDAIRWVLGEQKTRNLRSEKMENIIFNGTSKRKRSNFAEVSLTFENTKNILATEYTTVNVTRKYYRDGESGYFINGVSCRLKDIQNLFLDTGIGPDSYAIIELKMVDEILNDKENSRRTLFEEAAGISKYKIRKKQTLKKLQDTQADLDRVDDILFEIDKNLKSLERQAKKAEKYFKLKDQYKLISSRHAWFRIRDLQNAYDNIGTQEKNLTDQIGSIQGTIAKHEARIQELKKEQIGNDQVLAVAQKDLNTHIDKIRNIEGEKSIRNERLKFLQQREYAIGNQLESDKRTRIRITDELSLLKDQIEEAERDYRGRVKSLNVLKDALEESRVLHEEHKQQTENMTNALREVEENLQQQKKDKEIKEIQVQSLKSELQRTEADKSSKSNEINAFSESLGKLGKELSGLEKEVKNLKEKRELNINEVEKTRDSITELKDSIYKTNRGLDSRQNEYNLTKSLVENLEGFPESVKFLKKEAAWIKEAPLLSDIFSTSETYKVAIENLLEPYLSYYIVPSRSDALAAIKMLSEASKGRANFFILDELGSYKHPKKQNLDYAIPALEVVEVAETYQNLAAFLLEKVYIVKDEASIPDSLPEGIMVMNAEGNVYRSKYALGGGSVGLFQGKRLGRAKNLTKLDKEIKSLLKKKNLQKTDLEKLEKRLENLTKEDFSKQYEEKNQVLQQKKQQLSILMTREQEYKEFIRKAGERTDAIEVQIEELEKQVAASIPEIENLISVQQEKAAVLEEFRRILNNSVEDVNEKSQAFNKENIATIQVQNHLQNLKKDQEQKDQRKTQLEENESKLHKELEQARIDIQSIVSNTLQSDEEIVGLYEEKKNKEEKTERYEQISANIKSSLSQVDDKIRESRRLKEKVEEDRNNIKDRVSEIKIDLNSLKERMQVEFKIEISDLDEGELFDKPAAEFEPEKVEEEMMKIRQKIQNYGEINPMAVEAYNEMKERFDFITTQKNDLIEAKDTLLKTIEEIDETATKQFMEAFDNIRTNFIKVFQSLFDEGDTCDLNLADPSNPLESKIDIIARPKGKRPLTINQLSGGEKTLTAISLLFSIYLLKPAPFCVFDEVDAPLDDANIDKFNSIIKEFSSDSQFIIVTHNKRTMAATNVMYGVTMQENGISKVLPVDLIALNLN